MDSTTSLTAAPPAPITTTDEPLATACAAPRDGDVLYVDPAGQATQHVAYQLSVIDDDDDDQRPRALIVRVGNQEYGIPVEQVRGVVRHETLTRVPGAPEMVRGIANVRGSVVTVLELSVLLGTPRAVTTESIVLLEHGTRLVGITVDVVRDVRVFEPNSQLAGSDGPNSEIAPLDAVALCAPHLLSSEEMGP